jgi:hypothetical protein
MDGKGIVGKEVERPKTASAKPLWKNRNVFFRARTVTARTEMERIKCDEGIAGIQNGSPGQEERGRFGNGHETLNIREQ